MKGAWFDVGLHEDAERLEHVIVKDLKNEPRGHQEQLYQNLRVRKMLDTIQESASKLVGIPWNQFDHGPSVLNFLGCKMTYLRSCKYRVLLYSLCLLCYQF